MFDTVLEESYVAIDKNSLCKVIKNHCRLDEGGCEKLRILPNKL